MIVKKQYIPKRYRSKKLVNSGGGMVVGGSSASGSSVDTSAFLLADKFTSLFEYDEVNDAIKAKLPLYSEGEISAYGYGGSGGGGGTGIVYNGLDSVITDIALSAYMGNVLNTNKLEVSTFNSWVANYVPPAPAWGDVTGKPATFPATAHVHGWGEIENKPTTFAPSAHTHTWDSIESKPNVITGTTASFTTALETKLNGIAAGAEVNVQSDWNATSGDAFIANKPTVFTPDTHDHYVSDILNFPTSMPASDVYPWAKASVKPTYVWSEIGSKPTTFAPSAHTHYKSDIIDFAHTHSFSEIGITGLSTNYLTKYNGSTLVNSRIFDNGTNVGIGIASPNYKLDVAGTSNASVYYEGGVSLSNKYVTLSDLQTITGEKYFYKGVFIKQSSQTSPTSQPLCINGTGGGILADSAAIGFHNPGIGYASIVYHAGYFKFMDYQMGAYSSIMASTVNAVTFIGALQGNADTATKLATARTIAGTPFNGTANIDISYNNLTNLPSLAFLPLAGGTMTGNLTMGATTDIITNFKTWTKDSSKSLKSFLDKFDIDANGNLVVIGNLYSTGEVTAYSSGTGVSGLKLMGDLNANNYDINSAKSISVGDMKFGYVGDKMGLHEEITDATIAAFDENDYNYYFADNKLIYDNTNNIFSVTGQVNATEFKFGNYSFKQSANGLSICYNGVEQAYITNTGQYINS